MHSPPTRAVLPLLALMLVVLFVRGAEAGNEVRTCPTSCHNGTCVDGACACDHHFSPHTDCLDCTSGYYGAACDHACPHGGGANACGGEDQGRCSDGVHGSGLCTCWSDGAINTEGWCSRVVPHNAVAVGGAGSLLTFSLDPSNEVRGMQVQVRSVGGSAGSTPATGVFGWVSNDVVALSARDALWEGVACSSEGTAECIGVVPTPFPTNATLFFTIGMQSGSGYFTVDIADAVCPTGTFGPACSACPGGAQHACGEHGICDDGHTGTGTCTCAPGGHVSVSGLCAAVTPVGPGQEVMVHVSEQHEASLRVDMPVGGWVEITQAPGGTCAHWEASLARDTVPLLPPFSQWPTEPCRDGGDCVRFTPGVTMDTTLYASIGCFEGGSADFVVAMPSTGDGHTGLSDGAIAGVAVGGVVVLGVALAVAMRWKKSREPTGSSDMRSSMLEI